MYSNNLDEPRNIMVAFRTPMPRLEFAILYLLSSIVTQTLVVDIAPFLLTVIQVYFPALVSLRL